MHILPRRQNSKATQPRFRTLRWAVFLCMVWSIGPSHATTFVPGEPEELFAAADAVIVGRVEAIESVTNDEGTFTNITVNVELALGADTPQQLVLVEPGGDTAAQRRWVFGLPTFYLGERVLVFVDRSRRGFARSLYLALGKFRIVRGKNGQDYAVQNLVEGAAWSPKQRRMQRSFSRTYRLETLLERLGKLQRRRPRAARKLTSAPVRGPWVRPRFAFSGPAAARWFAPDSGQPLAFRIDPAGDAAIGPHNSIQAAKDAFQAWSNVACTALRFQVEEGVEPSPFAHCDGKSQVVFNDPFDDIGDPVNCVGVLGVGGVCGASGEARSFSGSSFFEISEGDVVIANGFAGCPFWNIPGLAEVLTHEVGHALGLAHSSDDPEERDPLRFDATMYFRAHFDYRGAALREDDRAAICSLYPTESETTVSFERAALVFDAREKPARHRLLLEGTFRVADPAWQLGTDAFFLAVRDGARTLVYAGISPRDWLRNARNNRYRWRARTAVGVTVVDVVQRDPQTYDFTLLARGDAVQPSATGSLTVSVTLGEASATTALPLRPGARLLRFP